jgi:hypothetical protein
MQLWQRAHTILDGLVVMIRLSHSRERGSIPRRGKICFFSPLANSPSLLLFSSLHLLHFCLSGSIVFYLLLAVLASIYTLCNSRLWCTPCAELTLHASYVSKVFCHTGRHARYVREIHFLISQSWKVVPASTVRLNQITWKGGSERKAGKM